MIDQIIDSVTNHPREILIWSHGFLAALALRRGRIETILDKVVPTPGGSGDKN